MPTKVIREPAHVDALAKMLAGRKLPITVSWVQGASRTGLQNALAFRWYADIARQLGDQTAQQVRAECKATFAAPILCADSEAFRLTWDALKARFSYEALLDIVEVTELPMTRDMTVKQMTAFMDAMHKHWTGQGVRLTDPEALKYEQEFI